MKKVGTPDKGLREKILSVYTTRIDTVYGMTYVVLAADHKDVNAIGLLQNRNLLARHTSQNPKQNLTKNERMKGKKKRENSPDRML